MLKWYIYGTSIFILSDPPKVKVSSSRISVKELSMAVLSCMGFGVPLPQLTWRRADGQEITGLLNQSVAISQDGQESATLELRLDNATSILNGVFVCSGTNNVTNLLNSPEEDEVILTVLGKGDTSSITTHHMSACGHSYLC